MNLSKYIIGTICVFSFFTHTVDAQIKLTVDRNAVQQTIHNFGASDAWRTQFVGKYWPLEKREAIADLLFSKDFDKNGNPKGVGLSLWRFNIGAGSTEQGDSSTIAHEWRRTECFLDKSGQYNWNKQEGQRWFLEAARKRGVEKILGFTNAAPYFMSKNGFARSSGGIHLNLKPDQYTDYARFLTEVCNHFKFDYLSPVNEPQWDWTGDSQEGTPATNQECSILIHHINRELQRTNSKCKITFGEAGAIRYLFNQNTDKPNRDNQIEDLFSDNGTFSISHLPHVNNCISGHSYWSVWKLDDLIAQRKALREKIRQSAPGFEYWQSEYCVMEKNDDIGGGPGRDLSINTALYVARIIHFDLTLANASSWQWWTAISEGDYKDGLVYIDDNKSQGSASPTDEIMTSCKTNGNYQSSKLLWALGNYSRFIRPEMKRIEISRNDSISELNIAQGLMASAYLDTNSDKLVLVAVNYSKEPQNIIISPINFSSKAKRTFKIYETSQTDNLSFKGKSTGKYSIRARSIITFVEE
ncbi:MAG: glycoside hydrolase [Bacteroidota bacterium]|nr:glycoside hydrolase [Bacteroidota bacterium]